MTTYTFTPINISQPIGSDVYVAADGIDTAGEVVGSYGYTDGDDDSYFHGFTATGSVGTTFDPPGSSNTNGIGITASGEIFGSYVDWENRQHGFVYSNGAFQQIDVLLASSTIVDGVTNAGTIFGTYVDEFGFGINGFIDNNGNFTIVDVPGASTTSVSGLNPAGEIVGTYTDGSGQAHGFTDINGTFATIDPAGSISTSVAGVSATGEVAGNYENSSSVNNGFIDNNGVITAIVIPGATETGVSAINDAGEVVGYYADSLGNVHGFIEQNGVTTTIDVPGATETDINGVSDSGIITGFYNDSSYTQHGFVGVPEGLIVDGTLSDAPQGGSPVALLTGATISDPGKANLASASVRVANGGGNAVAGDQLFVNGQQSGTVDGGAIAVTWNASTATLTLTGAASLATYQTLFSEVTYQDAGTDPSSGSHPQRTVTWSVNDGTQNLVTTSQVAIDRAPVANNDTATDVVGTILSVSAAGGVLANDTDPDADALSVASVSDTASGTVVVGQRIAGRYGHLWLSADGSYTYTADISAAINSAPTGSHLQDVFSYTASDGNGGSSNTATLDITLDRPPVVTVSNVTLPASSIVAASSLFSVSDPDPDGDPITQYSFYDDSRTAGSGEFLLNGAAQPKGTYQPLFVSAAQLSQVTFEAGAGGTADDLYIAAYDGSMVSNIGHLQVSAAEPPAPVVTASNVTLPQDDIVAASNLFSVTNPVGASPTTQYSFYDNSRTASSGGFLLNGVAQPKGTYQPLFVSAAQLSQVTFEAGAGGSVDDLYIAAYDGSVVSNIAHLEVNAAAPPAPVVTASNVTLPQNDIVAASSLFSVTNPAGASPTTQYSFYDDSRTASSGEFLLNGAAQPKGTYQPLFVSAAQLSQVTFEAGAGGTADDLYIAAYDGSVVSNIAHLQVSAAEPPAPVVSASNVTLPQNDIVAVSNLFSVTNPVGASPTTQYSFYDDSRTASSGEFLLNGVAQPKGTYQPLFVSASQLSQVTFEAGVGGTADDLYIAAYDGSVVSNIAHLQVSVAAPPAPVVTASNVALPQNDIVAASSLFSVTNPAGAQPTTQYSFYDDSRTASSGEFLLNGVAQPKGTYQPLFVSASQLSQVTFEAGAGGTADDLYIAAYDGSVVSNIAHLQVSATTSAQPTDGASGSLNHTVSLLSQYMASGLGDSDFGPANQEPDPKGAFQDQASVLAPTLTQSHPA